MNMSKHATTRSQQRAIPADCIDLIINHGTPTKKPGNAWEYALRKKDKQELIKHHKRMIQLVEKAAETAVLVADDNDEIVTVYNIN